MSPANDTPQSMGKILSNLQSLEFALRLFLHEVQKANTASQTVSLDLQSLSVGHWVPENPLTNYDTLGQLIEEVNVELQVRGLQDRVDQSIVELRDALAHGRVSSMRPEGPFRILKFSKPSNGKVQVTVAVEMTPKWLAQQINRTFAEMEKGGRWFKRKLVITKNLEGTGMGRWFKCNFRENSGRTSIIG